MENEILVVSSKVKAYIKSQGMNCAGDVTEILSNQLRAVLDSAIENAKRAKRKTVIGAKDLV